MVNIPCIEVENANGIREIALSTRPLKIRNHLPIIYSVEGVEETIKEEGCSVIDIVSVSVDDQNGDCVDE